MDSLVGYCRRNQDGCGNYSCSERRSPSDGVFENSAYQRVTGACLMLCSTESRFASMVVERKGGGGGVGVGLYWVLSVSGVQQHRIGGLQRHVRCAGSEILYWFPITHMHHVIIVALLQYSLSFRGLCSALYDPSVLLLVHVLGLCAFNTRHNRVSSSAYVMQ